MLSQKCEPKVFEMEFTVIETELGQKKPTDKDLNQLKDQKKPTDKDLNQFKDDIRHIYAQRSSAIHLYFCRLMLNCNYDVVVQNHNA
jgi:hypothetical protein